VDPDTDPQLGISDSDPGIVPKFGGNKLIQTLKVPTYLTFYHENHSISNIEALTIT